MNGPRRSGATTLGVLLFAAASILACFAEAATVRRGPYLQMGTQDRIVVRWRTDVPTDSRVSYGLCFGDLSCLIWERVDSTLTTEHEIVLEGLASNTRYYYAIGTTTEILAGNDSSHYFVTSVPAGISKRTRVWVLGDSGTGNISAQAVRDAYTTYAGSQHTDLWLMLGDNAYNRGTDAEYQTAVFNMYPEMLRKSVLWPSLGNHDGSSAESSTQTGPYFDIFTLPRNAEAGGVPSGTEAYYSYDYANIHFVVLDSFGSDRLPGGAMLTWLQADLQATHQDWIVAYWHHPPYSKGSHNSNTETALKQMRQNALPILEDYGVDLVLAGHSHAYERSFLLDGHYGVSTTLTPAMILDAGSGDPNGSGPYVKPARGTDPHKGTVYVVAGSSGKVSSEGALNHPAMFVSLESLGSLVLTVDGNRLDAAFLAPTGTVADSFAILKGSPSNIEVTPNVHAYDSVAVELEAVQTFQIRNRTTVDLEVTPSLVGDDIAEFSIIEGEAPFSILAGETRTLDVRFAPTSYGPKSALLRLTTNEPEQSPVDVSLSGIGVTAPDIDATLTALDYGDVLVGAMSTQTFTITNVGTADLQVSATSVVDGDAGEFVVAQGGAPFIVAPDATHSIDVHFAPATGGPKATTLRLTSDDPDESPLDLTLSGTALTAPEIDVVPSTHNFGVLWVGREAFAVFAVRNVGSADLQVVAADLVGGEAGDFGITEGAAPFTIAPGATHNLVVRFAPASAGGKNTTLRLSSDDQDESVLDLAAGGTGILPPDIDVLVAPDLGNVVIGTTALGTVVLRNLGGAELQVSASSLIPGEAEEFAITQGGAPFVVASGQTHSLEVRFTPTSRGPGMATLRLESDDPDESAVDVTIVGTGLLPADIDLGPPPQYGEVVVGTTATRSLVIRNMGDVELQVAANLLDGATSEFAIPQGNAPFTVMPGGSHSLDILFIPSSGGSKDATVRLASDDHDETTLDVILVGTGLMPPDIDLVPTPPDYGQLLVGNTVSKAFVIGNLGDVELQVTAGLIGGEAGQFALVQQTPFTVPPGATSNIDVTFAPTSGGSKTTTLRLASNDADENTIDVTLSGIGLMPADINLSTTAHQYGNVVVGTTAAGTLVIGNLGDVSLQVSAASLVGNQASEFAIAQGAPPFTIGPGGSNPLEVHFAPASGGVKSTTLRLTSDDTDETVVDVALTGMGLMPPDIDLDTAAHDYGQVVVGTTALRTIVVRNMGDVDLNVTGTSLIGQGAGEFAIVLGSGPFTVTAGATSTVEVRFVPTSGGAKSATLRLLSDDADEASSDVALSGIGLMPQDIELEVTALDYGQVVVGTTASRTIVVRNRGDVALQISGTAIVNGQAGEFTISQGGAPVTVAPGATHTIDVRFAPESGGPKTTALRVTSDDADEATLDVVLTGIGLMPADIDVSPMSHDYGPVVVGTAAVRTIAVRNLGDVDLHVTATQLSGGHAGEFAMTAGSAPFTVAPGATHQMDVRFSPSSGNAKATILSLTSDDGDEATTNVALSGTGLMPPDIDLNATAHNYGPIVVGTTASHSFVIRNLGDVDLQVHAITLVGAQASEFTILLGAGSVTVGPGAAHTVDVGFVPSFGGPKAATLRVTSDDADEGSLDIALSGVGLMPADIELVTTTHDYGPVVVGNTASATFVVRNLGDVNLHVTALDVASGDTGEFTVVQGAAPFTVAPGSTHSVDIRFVPASGGVKAAVLRLTSDDADEGTADIALNGTGLMPADIHLAQTSHDYGQVVVGTGVVRTIVVANLGDVDLQVTAIDVVDGTAAGFAISQGNAPFVVGPGATHNVDVRFAPTSAGDKTARFRLSSSDQDEAAVDVVVAGRGLMPPDIDLAPVAHDYGQVVVGTTAVRTVVVRNLGDVDLHVTSAGLIGGASAEFLIVGPALFTVGPGATYNLDLRFVPASGGPKSTILRLTSDDADESAVDIAISGVGMMPPDIDVGPMPFDYGDVLVGTSASRTFVIRNLGDIALQVADAVLAGSNAGEFSVTQGGAPFTVAPGATHDLGVRFAPTSGGPKSVTLRLASDDSDESSVDVVLSGIATTAPEIAVVLSPIHYGETLVGTTNPRTFAIENVGSADLHATAAVVGGDAAEFGVVPGSTFTVSPGATHTINVTFTPASGGTKTTALRLTSDDTDEATVDVALDGIGMMPADIDVGSTAHNYGDVLLGTTASKTFAIRNLGDVGLQVSIAAILDDETNDFAIVQGAPPFSVAPGATHNLEIRFAPTSAGLKEARLRITSDDQDENVVDVILNGTATTAPELEVVTASQNYGVVWVGADGSRTLAIRNIGSADLQVTGTSLVGDGAGEFAIVQGAAPFTVPVGAMHQLEVRFAPTSPGAKDAMLRILTNDQDEVSVDLSVSGAGVMPPDVDVTPPQHDFGEVVITMPRSRTVSVRNVGGADLRVTAASLIGANADEFAIAAGGAPFTVAAGATQNIEIQLAPTSEGTKSAALRLVSDDPDEAAVDVQLTGTATILVPDIAALPVSHDFGSQGVDTATTQGFVVSNTGTKNLVLGASTLSGPEADAFAITSGQAGTTIAPGATQVIQIRFSPATAGPKAATLTIPSDDPDENPLLIPLRGTTPPTFVEATEGGSANISTVTTATALTGATGHLYLAAVSTKPYRQVSALSGLGLTWTRVATQCAGRSQTGIELWSAQGSATSGQVTASLVSAPNNAVIAVARYGGVATTNPLTPLVTGNTNGVSGNCGNATDTATYVFNVSPSGSNSLVVGAVALRNKTHNSGSGYVTRIEVSHGTAGNVAGIALVDRVVPLATTMPLHGTLNSPVDWAVIATELRSEP